MEIENMLQDPASPFAGPSLSQLPPEIVQHMAIQFLDPISVLYLSHTHYRLRNILSSQQLWKALSTHWHKINYIEPGGDWKRNCFDREFIEACCPHLSTLNQKHVIADRSSTYQNFMLKTSVKCTHQDCQFGPQDIWFCLSENCDSVGCSRSKNKHALKHHEATRHLMTIRVTTLEAWCYDCVKWVGNPCMPMAEQVTIKGIIQSLIDAQSEPFLSLQKEAALRDRRFRERDVYNLDENDKIYFLSIEFLTEWSFFLMDNVPGPNGIKNGSLVAGYDENGKALMKHNVIPHRDFGIVSEASWNYLFATYGGDGPPLSLDNIPANDPEYLTLRESIASSRATIIAQCKENRQKIVPGTGRPRSEHYIIKSSLYKLIESRHAMTHPILNTGVPNGATRRRRSSVEEHAKEKFCILDLASEVIFMTAYNFLDATSVLALIGTCSKMRSILNNSQYLWAKLAFDKHGINYIETGGNWRTACFDPEFYDLCCPHLSTLSASVIQERTQFYQTKLDSADYNSVKCTHESCTIGPPDLWMCLSPGCQSTACGRSRKQHALHHTSATKHPLSLKIHNLEVWCYSCIKWVGNPYQPKAEQQKLSQITSQFLSPQKEPFRSLRQQVSWNPRRIEERMMHVVEEGDRLFFLSRDFLREWTRFLMGDGDPPKTIDNSALVAPNILGGVNSDEHVLMNPALVPHHDFGIISETSWIKLVDQYGGGPALSEDSIPKDDPVYFSLWREVKEAQASIVNQCQGDVQPAARITL